VGHEKVVKIGLLYRPNDGARFALVSVGKRNSRSFQYRATVSSSLKVWGGRLTPQQAHETFSHHETVPPFSIPRRSAHEHNSDEQQNAWHNEKGLSTADRPTPLRQR